MIVMDKALQKKLKEKYRDEQVLIVQTRDVVWLGDKFTPADKNTKSILDRLQLESKFVYRSDAEYNSAFQQLIPYCVIRNKDGNKFFMNERKSGESRLISNYSIGFGGHINPIDGRQNAIENGLKRELEEELYLPEKFTKKFMGYTRDLASELTDHIGLIYEITTSNMNQTKVKETDSMIGQWVSLDELVNKYYNFEGWSQYLIDYYYSESKK